jgi:cobalt/nickel transport system ATP-binding protein
MTRVPAVKITQLRYTYPDGTAALDGIDLVVNPGERLGIIGANGAGKSTLLLHLNGTLRGGGLIEVFGTAINGANLKQIRCQVGLVFQNPDDQLFCPTLFEDIAFGPRNMGIPEDEVRTRVANALESVGLRGLEHKSAYHLSIGQKKRAALATILSMRPRLVVLDEPTSNLDPRARRDLLGLLESLGGAQILATHDLDLVRHNCTRVLFLDRGQTVADGPPTPLLDDTAFLESHGL